MVAQAVDALVRGRRVLVLADSQREAGRIERLIRDALPLRAGRYADLRCVSAERGVDAVRGEAFEDLFTDHHVYDVDAASRGAGEIVEWLGPRAQGVRR